MLNFSPTILGLTTAIKTSFSGHYSALLTILGTSLLIAIYCILLWKFHKFVTKKNILSLNLAKYNESKHPLASKLFATLLFILEYIIIFPLIICVWFVFFAVIILLLSGSKSIESVIIISVAIISAIRILSYYKEDLSQDVAKLMPLTILVIFVTNPEFYSLNQIITNVLQLPEFLSDIVYYFVFIAALELLLRLLSMLFSSEDN